MSDNPFRDSLLAYGYTQEVLDEAADEFTLDLASSLVDGIVVGLGIFTPRGWEEAIALADREGKQALAHQLTVLYELQTIVDREAWALS